MNPSTARKVNAFATASLVGEFHQLPGEERDHERPASDGLGLDFGREPFKALKQYGAQPGVDA